MQFFFFSSFACVFRFVAKKKKNRHEGKEEEAFRFRSTKGKFLAGPIAVSNSSKRDLGSLFPSTDADQCHRIIVANIP